ncbi:MAG: hypothetical protein GTO30_09420, partial [Acidobacteria bacterium]|nr:hypothetical protein [Acidobacteriota bacterium]NIQ86953.1 hypothetical protein [Acidobacteriota bacterium]
VAVEGGYEISLGDDVYRIITDWWMGEPVVRAQVNGRPVIFQMDRVGLRYRLSHRG